MEINKSTYEEFFLLYIDGELNASERQAVENFAEQHPHLKEELEMLKSSVLTPDNGVVFENKEELYKKEERKIIAFGWWKMVAAAILLIGFGTFGWLYIDQKPEPQAPAIAETDTKDQEKMQPANADTTTGANENNNVENKIRKAEKTEPAVKRPVYKKSESSDDSETPKIKPLKIIEPQDVTNIPREPSNNNIEMATIDETNEKIEINVAPRKIEDEIKDQKPNALYAKNEIADQQHDDDMIYFANTSFSKRNKLRGAFRKATRFIDKVTSLQ